MTTGERPKVPGPAPLHWLCRWPQGRTCGSCPIFMPGSLFLVRKHEAFIPLVEMKGTKMRNSNRAMHAWYPNSVLTTCQMVPWELVLWSGPKVQAYTVSLSLFSSPCHGHTSSPFLLLPSLLPWLLSGLSKCPWAPFFLSLFLQWRTFCLPSTEDPWISLPESLSETSQRSLQCLYCAH